MVAAATLYLKADASGLRAGASEAATRLKAVQREADVTSGSLARASTQMRYFGAQAGSLPGTFVPANEAIRSFGDSTNKAGGFLGAFAGKLTSVGGYAKVFAGQIRTMLIVAPIMAAATAATSLLASAFSDLIGPTEAEAERVDALTKALDGYIAKAESAKRSSETLAEIGDVAGARAAQKERLAAIEAAYAEFSTLKPGEYVRVKRLTDLGIAEPAKSTQFEVPGTVMQELRDERQYAVSQMDALAATKQYIDVQKEAIGADKQRAQSTSQLAIQMRAFVDQVQTFASLPPSLQIKYAGVQARSLFGGDGDAGAESADEKLKRQTREAYNRLNEQRLADIEADQAKAEAKRRADAEKQAARSAAEFQRSANRFGAGFESAATDLLHGMTSVGGALAAFAQSIADTIIQQQVVEPAGQAVGAGLAAYFGGGAGAAPSAMGNVFDHGLTRFAHGGIVTRPTHFAYGGGIGLMGEAGPEAVVPLKRGRDGRLGVEAGGRGPTVINVNVSGVADAKGMRTSGKQAAQSIDRRLSRR